MSDPSMKFTRLHKLLLASLATVSLSLGAAGVVSAAQNPSASNKSEAPAKGDADAVQCDNGLDAAGAECDGGPSANAADDPAESKDKESKDKESKDDEVGGVDCENGIVAATGAECDGGPSANPQDGADDAAEGPEASE